MYRFLIAIGVILPGKESAGRQILFFFSLGYLPLLLLSFVEGLHWVGSVEIPFLREITAPIRFAVVIPLLIIAESIVDKQVKLTLRQFENSCILTETGKVELEIAKSKADRLGESIWADLVILSLIIFNLFFQIQANPMGHTSWAFPSSENPQQYSLAGYWAYFVSFPIFQFILLRWLWRWIIWSRMMKMIAHSELALIPTHTDRSGGLGFLGEPPMPFSIFTLALSILFSGFLAERVTFQNFDLNDNYLLISLFAFLCILINLLPLLPFIPVINRARIQGISNYHALISQHHMEFHKKWILGDKKPNQEILGSADASSFADIQEIYTSVKKMTIFPFDIKTMITTLMIVLLPLLFVFALQVPILEVLKKLIGILL